MAANKVGAMWLGLSPKFSLDELTYIVGDASPTVLITLRKYQDTDLSKVIAGLRDRHPGIKKILVIGEPIEGTESYREFVDTPRETDAELEARAAEVAPDSDALLMYTSGSTGKPKGVVQTHASILANVAVQNRHFDMGDPGRVLLHFPINHVAADVEIGFAAVFQGGTVVLMESFDPVATLNIIGRERITLFGQVPAMFLLEFGCPNFKDTDWSSLKTIIWGGSSAPKEIIQVLAEIAEQNDITLMTGYGSTEMCGFCTFTSPDDDLETLAVSAGRPVPEFEMKVVDDDRQEVSQGTVGEFAFRGPITMNRYFNKPEATAKVIDEDGWLYTNDLGYVDDNGNLIITGRKSEMFKTGGENVFPREIEAVIEQLPQVLMAAVVGVPDDLYQEVGHAFVMPYPGQEIDEETVRIHCRATLANFKVPKKIEVRPMLPLLPNGKVSKMALKTELGLN
jgi:acyl-CoA synthetase (AMP-forming)/AMP-acid ligase II